MLHHGSLHQADRQNKEILLTQEEEIMILKAKIKRLEELIQEMKDVLNEN